MSGRKRKSSESAAEVKKVRKVEDVNKEQLEDLNVDDLDLNEANIGQVWEKFNAVLAEEALQLLVGEISDVPESSLKILSTLIGVAKLTIERFSPPESLIQSMIVLHNVLPNCGGLGKLTHELVHLCESWYKNDLPQKESLCVNALIVLLKQASTKADVKRVFNLRDALYHFRLQDQSAQELKRLLLKAFSSQLYLKCSEGIRFLAFLFTISPSFVEELNLEVKKCLNSSNAEQFGEVYFKAWRASSGPFRERIEIQGIQTFMHHSVLASKAIFRPLGKLLDKMHKAKNDRQLQKTLYDLWEPILWRHLKVANPEVRTNAMEMLGSAFPLENPDADIGQKSATHEKQYGIISRMLMDEDPNVRIATINSVLVKICPIYWTIVPNEVLNKWLNILVKNLAFDASSFKVRLSVIKGLRALVESCPRSHVAMHKVLPKISDCLHDINEAVRSAVVDLLTEVKKIRTIAYFSVCPMEDILARMEVDKSPNVVRKIASLILNSFFPVGDNDAQFERCVKFVDMNGNASRKFYRYLAKKASVHDTVLFMLTVLVKIKKNVFALNKDFVDEETDEDKENEGGDRCSVSSGSSKKTVKSSSSTTTTTTPSSSSSADQNKLNDDNIVSGLLDTVAIMWVMKSKELSLAENTQYRRLMEKKSGKILTVLFKHYKNSDIVKTVAYLCSMLPHNHVSTIAGFCLSKIKKSDETWSYVDCLCNWGRGDDLSELIIGWIKNDPLIRVESNRKKVRAVRFEESVDSRDQTAVIEKSTRALKMVKYITEHPVNRAMMLKKNRANLEEIRLVLEKFLPVLNEDDGDSGRIIEAFEVLLTLTVLLHTKDNSEETLTRVEDILTHVYDAPAPILEKALTVCINMITIGVCDVNFNCHVVELAEKSRNGRLCILLCHEIASWVVVRVNHGNKDDYGMLYEKGIPDIMAKAVKEIKRDEEDFKDVKGKIHSLLDMYKEHFYKFNEETLFGFVQILLEAFLDSSEQFAGQISPVFTCKPQMTALLLEELLHWVQNRNGDRRNIRESVAILTLLKRIKCQSSSSSRSYKSNVEEIIEVIQPQMREDDEFHGELEERKKFEDLKNSLLA